MEERRSVGVSRGKAGATSSAPDAPPIFDPYLRRWRLEIDGVPFRSQSSDLLAVLSRGRPAMLKVPFEPDERLGGILMRWWDGDGAAKLFQFDEPSGAMVLERACGPSTLCDMREGPAHEEAVRILCATAGRLHAARERERPDGLVPLREWFQPLREASSTRGGAFAGAWSLAHRLLEEEREIVTLHGDIHHGNVLDFGVRGWLAIDPKHIFGERTFDYVNILRNPDPDRMPDPATFRRTVALVVEAAGLDERRYLEWTCVFAMLSAAWILDDGGRPLADLAVAELAGAAPGFPKPRPSA